MEDNNIKALLARHRVTERSNTKVLLVRHQVNESSKNKAPPSKASSSYLANNISESPQTRH